MTRLSKRELERSLDGFDDGGNEGEIYVVSIGGDSDKPSGWLSLEEYERHYGDRPESDFEFTVEYPDQ